MGVFEEWFVQDPQWSLFLQNIDIAELARTNEKRFHDLGSILCSHWIDKHFHDAEKLC